MPEFCIRMINVFFSILYKEITFIKIPAIFLNCILKCVLYYCAFLILSFFHAKDIQITFGKNVYTVRCPPTLELRNLWRRIISRSGHIMYGTDRTEN